MVITETKWILDKKEKTIEEVIVYRYNKGKSHTQSISIPEYIIPDILFKKNCDQQSENMGRDVCQKIYWKRE